MAQFVRGPMAREWDLVFFDDLPSKDRMLDAFKDELGALGIIGMSEPRFPNIVLDLSRFDTSQSFYSALSRNLRRSLVRSEKKLTRDGGFYMAVYSLETCDVDHGMSMYNKVYGDSWKGEEADPCFHRKLAHYLARIGALRLFLLYYKKGEPHSGTSDLACNSFSQQGCVVPEGYNPVAARFVVVYKGKAYDLKTAYNKAFVEYSVGSLLMWFVLRYLLDVDHVSSLDFQKGSESFKLNFKGTLNDVRARYRGFNSCCMKGLVESHFEAHAIPFLRKIRHACQTTKCKQVEQR
ncbi:hypothetical protein DSLASN_27150 [Desulfoluna limicola]|uniref:BioF2-like acetyltransferase domain-containing protein n=2 Tax=Desulfoluna limicola TaxID=2810562 RepID=A0ABM7PIL3_9BACT|nr:hypothetical protein DSLASN_27150 [Desulfoluna limicola]